MTYVQPADLLLPLLLGLLVWAALRTRVRSRLSVSPFPPGPKPLPIIGNLLDMPTKNMAPLLHEMGKRYGELMYLNVFGQPTLIVDSYDAAFGLLENRSSNTSDRPRLVMGELTGLDWEFSLVSYNATWKRCRRTFHDHFHSGAVAEYRPNHVRAAHKWLAKLLEDPRNFRTHGRRALGATVMDVVYGMQVVDENDKYVSIAERGAAVFSEVAAPGRFLAELFPSLAYVPAWLPGAQFKRDAAKWARDLVALREVPWGAAIGAMAHGTAKSSIVSKLMDSLSREDEKVAQEDIEHFKDVIGIAYVGAVDTTFSTLTAFILAMTAYPEAQRKAQAELDAVIGPDRLPTFEDRDSLPYVNALLKETTRWHPVLPLAIPHKTTEEDVYNGYHIPAGTVIIPNSWAMSRDPSAYPDPFNFVPERYLDPDTRDPSRLQFGFGRRICPGRHFAVDALFIFIASILHVYNIQPPLGPDGKPQEVKPKVNLDCALSYPEDFLCQIKTRSSQAEALIKQASSEQV